MMMRILLLVGVWCVAYVTSNDISLDRGFTKAQQQNMIDLHNYYRARVAKGEERNQPQAADMLAMVSVNIDKMKDFHPLNQLLN